MERSVVVAASAEVAFDCALGDPLPTIFDRGHLLLPAIVGTERMRGAEQWGTEVRQRRRILLADGSSMVETIVAVEAPHRAAYIIDELTGPFAALFTGVLGEWIVEPAGAGARVTWRWRLRPKNPAGRVATPLIARMWQGYAAKALDRIAERLATL